MAETKEITRIYVVTDSDNGYEHIGDIDGGGIEDGWLRSHIRKHGHQGLLDALAWMTFQVWGMVREVNAEKSNEHPDSIKPSTKEPEKDLPSVCLHRFHHVENDGYVYCTDCNKKLGSQKDC